MIYDARNDSIGNGRMRMGIEWNRKQERVVSSVDDSRGGDH